MKDLNQFLRPSNLKIKIIDNSSLETIRTYCNRNFRRFNDLVILCFSLQII